WNEDPAGLELELQGHPDREYSIEATLDFETWEAVATQLTDESGVFRLIDPASTYYPHRLYRAVRAH
ncbi:MAG TPA: hypothetical protein VMS21_02235, partial [Methylomirabilota bacterium]|nr:hypothetical protein [Methylomirabilota bacterium]